MIKSVVFFTNCLYLSKGKIFCIFFPAGSWEKDDVIYGLNQLQLNHTLDQ